MLINKTQGEILKKDVKIIQKKEILLIKYGNTTPNSNGGISKKK